MKRILSTLAIVLASVTFGVLISADLGLMPKSNAQTSAIQTTSGAVSSVTIPSFADVAAKAAPAVVSITTTEIVKESDMRKRGGGGTDPFEFFFPNPNRGRGQSPNSGDDEHKQMSGGSGFIISPDGYIITNNHVVEDANKVEVHYGADENGDGGHTATARIIGRDPATDLALLKIESSTPLPTLPLGDSDRLRKGDWAVAIGNPFQFENTLTVGVISAKGRSLGLSDATRNFENFIQTDAAINFGNSGGPLLNINGEVIGINTAIRAGGAQNLGFATPINTARLLLPQLKEGKVVRGYLGMTIGEISDKEKEAFNLPAARGALVQSTEPGKPAEKAGVQNGDVIVKVDEKEVRRNRDLIDYVSSRPVGSNVKLTVIRDGKQVELNAKTAMRPPDGVAADDTSSSEATPARNKLGMQVQELSAGTRQMYNIDDTVRGVLVTNVKEVSSAGDAGLQEGDVISSVNGVKVTTAEEFHRVVNGAKSGSYLRIYVTSTPQRGGGRPVSRFAIVQVP
jgi:serine protease Do